MTLALCACPLVLCACGGKKEEIPVIPPATSPLSRQFIGFGVINVSYTHVNAEPDESSVSVGYLRRGSLVSVSERRTIKNNTIIETWVLVEGIYRGWLNEAVMDIYANEGQARTASESMSR
ncbi:hypothetical protein AGMMS50293_20000 [Spirochaetia bacterium]|nr:hypothetical protein AGMMS50293_20000 [Spirochaetia bacterium]